MLKPGVEIGDLTERITLQSFTTAQSASGHESVTYSDLAEVWAKVEYRMSSSDEAQLANKKTAVGMAVFTIRNEYAVTAKMRVVFNSENYDIGTVAITPEKQYMILETEKRV